MELQLHLHGGAIRKVDWFAAGVAGFAAGAVMMVLELVWAASMSGDGPWRVTQLVAALVLGAETAAAGGAPQFDLVTTAVALGTHYALGIFSGFVVAWILTALHRVGQLGMAELVGGLFGTAVYFVNFHLLTALAPWFVELRGWGTFILHIVFGLVAAVLYTRFARRGLDAGVS